MSNYQRLGGGCLIAGLGVLALTAGSAQAANTLGVEQARVSGRYSWVVIGHFHNDNPKSVIKHTITYEENETIDRRSFYKEALNINKQTKYASETSLDVKYRGAQVTAGLNSKFSYTYAEDLAQDVTREDESNYSHGVRRGYETAFIVDPGADLTVWQLVYEMPGGTLKTPTITNVDPGDSVPVQVDYTVTHYITGLPDMLKLMADTFPLYHNLEEWKRVRNSIVASSAQPDYQRFYDLVQVLADTHPLHDNTVEWALINQTASEILAAWDSQDKQDLFQKLLLRLSTTHPQRDNILEWNRISALANDILGQTQNLSF
jgi:hypothetical protein